MSDPARPVFDMSQLASRRWKPPAWHAEKIAEESACPEPKDRMLRVIRRMAHQRTPDFADVDWDAELAAFEPLEYPAYYVQPFHSVPGGYLSEAAATGDRAALEAIYEQAHPEKSLGLRKEIAKLFPESARRVVDLGAGTGDGGAAVARRLSDAEVIAVEASPFMIVCGRRQNGELPNLRFQHGFAESTGLPDASVDAVHVTLVFHECPDAVKRAILDEARRILVPGGLLVLSDTPNDDLHDYRGFYEPYREQWLRYDPDAALREAGFVAVEAREVAAPLWTRLAHQPA